MYYYREQICFLNFSTLFLEKVGSILITIFIENQQRSWIKLLWVNLLCKLQKQTQRIISCMFCKKRRRKTSKIDIDFIEKLLKFAINRKTALSPNKSCWNFSFFLPKTSQHFPQRFIPRWIAKNSWMKRGD